MNRSSFLKLRIGTNIIITGLALIVAFTSNLPVGAEEPAPQETSTMEDVPTQKSSTDKGAQSKSSTTAQEASATESTPVEPKPLKIPLTEIIGTSPTAMDHIPGSGKVVTSESIQNNHRFTINEALREVPGVHIRDEEGLGIRPNIGIRGLDPTRSRKVHIMEDGVPIMMMPYADPSSYYFPPIFRFDRIEVLKGSGQLMYGPQTIGGVINLITRMPPPTPEGHFQVWGGNLNYLNTHFDYGGTWGKSGYLVDYTHSQMDTPRFTNIRAKIDDLTFKFAHELRSERRL